MGFELEFAGLDLEAATKVVHDLYGGEIRAEGPYRHSVTGTSLGDFQIEVDARMLHDRRYLASLEALGLPVDLEELERPIEKLVDWFAELVVPFEVTTPPLDMADLHRVEDLRIALAAEKARGTGSRLRYALGLHINPEAPSLEAESVLAHLRAFLVLYEWLVEESDIDVTRNLSPFIDEFPAAYRDLVLQASYSRSMGGLADDYLSFNPTRSRPLDLLPLFVHVLGEKVLEQLGDEEKVKPRPAFHYRLPNCRLDEPDWTVAEEWNRWVEVERLAARPADLANACEKTLDQEKTGLWKTLRKKVSRMIYPEKG